MGVILGAGEETEWGVRLCVYYRRLNSLTVKEPYNIPGFEEMIEMVGKRKVLSKVDLSKGFN